MKCEICNNKILNYSKLCDRCYKKQYYINNKENIRKNHKKYYKKNKPEPTINKSCSSYLGIVIAEQVLSKVFKNVEIMPHNNPGFDFICGNGFKIDVKSSCRYIRGITYSDIWMFNINKNIIADYFLCLAFDNRTDLNPQYLWLIRGDVVNDKSSLLITESKISKWDEYKQDISKVITTCNTIRGN